MLLEIGMEIVSKDVHGDYCKGTIVRFLENTVVIEDVFEKSRRYLLSKKSLEKEGFCFPTYK